jgi:hypothetical protein
MIFAREINDSLTGLVKKIDEATARNPMGSFVVFLTDDQEKLQTDLKALAKKEGIKKTVLATDNNAGPGDYKIAREAAVTVILYVEQKVVVNKAFKKGELKASDVQQIVKDLGQILPKE